MKGRREKKERGIEEGKKRRKRISIQNNFLRMSST